MELMELSGNVLKVYLALVAARETGDWCPLSQRELSRQIRLPGATVNRAFQQLARQGLIVAQEQGWWVRTEPLEWLLPPWRDETDSEDVAVLAEAWN